MQRKMNRWLAVAAAAGMLVAVTLAGAADKPAQLKPNRLCSTGDSMTEAVDAELPGDNHWASWANGYHGFWQALLGLSDVKSHNQRIRKQYGTRGNKNFMAAKSGADSFDFAGQAQEAVARQATYVTVLMGHNDVCQNNVLDQPTADQFEANMEKGFEILNAGLPAGATIYVVGMVDIYELWLLGEEKKALGIIDCDVLWMFTLLDLFPCGTVLNPFLPEADRLASQALNQHYNQRLEGLVKKYQAGGDHHWYYTNSISDFSPIPASYVSDIDCFHPSARGQKEVSKITWENGPFKQ